MSNDLVTEIDDYLRRLFPINRSLTGEGNRETLRILQEIAPFEITEYPSGLEVYDWVIPEEWHLRDAWIKDESGQKLIDVNENNLHIVGYSEPVIGKFSFDELDHNLHTIPRPEATPYHTSFPEHPEAIPYRTSYYKRDWGFCVNTIQYDALKAYSGKLEVCIDSEFLPKGSMSMGELFIPGKREEEYLVSTYICHPSMANDNLSGMITAAILARIIMENGVPENSWRFVFAPETIGAITYLNHHEKELDKVCGGLVVTCCGGKGRVGYKKSFLEDNIIDRAIEQAFRDLSVEPLRYPFYPSGGDERQYSSPGFRIPVATICKDKYHEYYQYHNSLDDLSFVNGSQVAETLGVYEKVFEILNECRTFTARVPHGEPRLGKRGLYPAIGGGNKPGINLGESGISYNEIDIINWVLFLADGQHDLLSISELSGIPYENIVRVAKILEKNNLLDSQGKLDSVSSVKTIRVAKIN